MHIVAAIALIGGICFMLLLAPMFIVFFRSLSPEDLRDLFWFVWMGCRFLASACIWLIPATVYFIAFVVRFNMALISGYPILGWLTRPIDYCAVKVMSACVYATHLLFEPIFGPWQDDDD